MSTVRRVPWIAGLLSFITPGLGHVYAGQPKRGIVVIVIALAFAGCAGLRANKESLDMNFGDYVYVAHSRVGPSGIGTMDTYAKPGATVENWTVKLVVIEIPNTIIFYFWPWEGYKWNAESVMNYYKVRKLKACPTGMWKVVQVDPTSILYEWLDISCPGVLFQRYEIGRIVMGGNISGGSIMG